MCIVMVPILINKELFEPSYNYLKFMVKKMQSPLHQPDRKRVNCDLKLAEGKS